MVCCCLSFFESPPEVVVVDHVADHAAVGYEFIPEHYGWIAFLAQLSSTQTNVVSVEKTIERKPLAERENHGIGLHDDSSE